MGWSRPLHGRPYRRVQGALLSPRRIPVPFWRPAYRPLVRLRGDRHLRADAACAREERPLPTRFRRLRPPGRERGYQTRPRPEGVDLQEHRADEGAAREYGAFVRLVERGHRLRPWLLSVDPV